MRLTVTYAVGNIGAKKYFEQAHYHVNSDDGTLVVHDERTGDITRYDTWCYITEHSEVPPPNPVHAEHNRLNELSHSFHRHHRMDEPTDPTHDRTIPPE